MTLERRTPLKRGTSQLKRTALARGTKPINKVSKRRQRVNAQRKKAQVSAWGPRPWRCRFDDHVMDAFRNGVACIPDITPCFGKVDGHEILSRAQSGRDENLVDVSGQVPLCARHNEWVDTHHAEAELLGLRRPWTEEVDG